MFSNVENNILPIQKINMRVEGSIEIDNYYLYKCRVHFNFMHFTHDIKQKMIRNIYLYSITGSFFAKCNCDCSYYDCEKYIMIMSGAITNRQDDYEEIARKYNRFYGNYEFISDIYNNFKTLDINCFICEI